MDNTYNYSMWVELYNPEDKAISLRSCYFTDDLSQPQKWAPAVTAIPAQSYKTYWFERPDQSGHANFKLDPEGGTLYLLNSKGEIIDSVKYPRQYRNISYGRLTDGGDDWVYFIEPSSAASNNGKEWGSQRCTNPVFQLEGGFYSGSQNLIFETPAANDTIYYTRNGAEPTRQSTRYAPGRTIQIVSSTCIRAKTFSAGKIPSDVVSNTYLINERKSGLPVVSIATDPKNLTDPTIGIYVEGTNGITGNCYDRKANWNRDWDRPANFELFDANRQLCLNQELDIAISGGCSRTFNPQKSLKISPRKKFGDNHLRYDFFSSKPKNRYKDIQIRNSGNDFSNTMMRDAFMQSLITNRMDIDHQAYEPAVCYINGKYYGIQNLRERTSKDFIYSNYGLDEEDFDLLDHEELSATAFKTLTNLINQSTITSSSGYRQIENIMDVNNYIQYMIAETYYGNTDWPHNNMKVWKKKEGGKWRWILFDTDFGFELVEGYNHNTLEHAINSDATIAQMLRRLLLNETFKNKFIDQYSIHLSSTFKPERVSHILDSISGKIRNEIPYHKSRWGQGNNFDWDIERMRTFGNYRANKMLEFVSNRFLNSAPIRTVKIQSNIPEAYYTFNGEEIADNSILLKSFENRDIKIEAKNIRGYNFKHWELIKDAESVYLLNMGSNWKYWDRYGTPSPDWNKPTYTDNTWSSGLAQLGYGNKGEITQIGYGSDAQNKYPTAYFRTTFTVTDIDKKDDFIATVFVDDGAVVYVNGIEIGRVNLHSGAIDFNTYTIDFNDGITANFNIPKALLHEGENLIAAEVHQTNATSSDLIFNMSVQCQDYNAKNSTTTRQRIYAAKLSDNIILRAIYEKNGETPIDERPEIYINEIVANNKLYPDEYGDFDDYIELYNASDEDINIGGWFISDTPANPALYQFPDNKPEETTITGKGRIIVWADKQPDQGALHAFFNLSKESETVILSRMNEDSKIIVVDSITYPNMSNGMSYSRNPDGSDNWVVQAPTFNEPNSKPSSLDEIEAKAEVYPTYVQDQFYVKNAAGETVRIYDLTGNMLHRQKIAYQLETIQASHLRAGMYIVIVGNDSYKIVKR